MPVKTPETIDEFVAHVEAMDLTDEQKFPPLALYSIANEADRVIQLMRKVNRKISGEFERRQADAPLGRQRLEVEAARVKLVAEDFPEAAAAPGGMGLVLFLDRLAQNLDVRNVVGAGVDDASRLGQVVDEPGRLGQVLHRLE